MAKYIITTGGVISGTGKGISAASIGLLMKMRGHSVQTIKFDPYLNVNAGTMNPHQHGETFVCNDGSETDLDLGHYERISGIEVSAKNIYTSGTLYKEVLQEEEEGKYLGQTVQIIPHVTDKIQNRLLELGQTCDLVVAEIGGTVGDLESGPFLEAIRQFSHKYSQDVLLILVSPILWIPTIKEFKTKPLQNSVKTLQGFGLTPDILLCRVDRNMQPSMLDKIAHLTNVPRECIFEAPDVQSIYQVPIEFYNRHIDDLIADKFHLKRNGCRIQKYRDLVEKYVNNADLPVINIGIAGKYSNGDEAYISLKEALYHSGVTNNVKVNIEWINAEDLENTRPSKFFENLHGLIIPGGFDSRGVEGKINAIRYAREKKIPFLGICLGLQCAVIEFARNVLGKKLANSVEFNKEVAPEDKVVHFVEGQENIRKKCGTMRLGAFECELTKDSLALALYKKKTIHERHRHRYEVNDAFVEDFQKKGFIVSGRNPQTDLIEIMELSQDVHPFFIGTQAHPEFKSRLGQSSPLFDGLILAAIEKDKKDNTKQV